LKAYPGISACLRIIYSAACQIDGMVWNSLRSDLSDRRLLVKAAFCLRLISSKEVFYE
jgi:hypothetical protein